jgi:hypothetical protein
MIHNVMTKKLTLNHVAISILVVLFIAACGSKTQTPASQQESPTESVAEAQEFPTSTSPAVQPTPTQPAESAEEKEVAPTAAPQATETSEIAPTTEPHPGLNLSTFRSDDFVGSGSCAICHTSLVDTEGNDMSFDTHWRSAMMANAARDPIFTAVVAAEIERYPALKAVIEGKCAACHMPMAHIQADESGQPVAIFGDGFSDPEHPLHEAAFDGVSCALCHQIQAEGLGEETTFSGEYEIDTSTEEPDRILYGPYPDSELEIMRSGVGYTAEYGPHMLESSFCATCHTLYTPYVDAEGNVLGVFPEQVAFLEWQQSEFGNGDETDIQCQGCHMPEIEGEVMISIMPQQPRSPVSKHYFVGSNTMILSLLKNNVEALEITASTDNFDTTIERTTSLLQQSAANLSVQDIKQEGDKLNILLQVENLAGHKVPTGIPLRQMWIHLSVTDSSGQIIFESGEAHPDGSIMGNDADQDRATYEPHYDVISDPFQVQIYESLMQNSDGDVTYSLLRGAAYIKDNRLLPSGFNKDTALADTAVHGGAADDESFIGGTDQITYIVDVDGFSGPYSVSAELLFHAVSYSSIADLLEQDLAEVNAFEDMYSNVDKMPVVMVAVEATVD